MRWRVLVLLVFAVSNPVLADKCWEQLAVYAASFKDVSSMPLWVMQMFDSSTKIPEGILAGNQKNLGNFDECLSVQNVETAEGEVSGKYCLLTLELPLSLGTSPQKASVSSRMHRYNESMKAVSVPVSVAMCIPSACTAQDAGMFTEMMWTLLFNITVTAQAQDKDCQVREQPLEPTDWVTVMLLVVLATLVVGSTAYDLLITDTDRRIPLMLSFSVYTNGKRILDTSVPRDSLTSLNGIRFFSISWIMLGHFYTASATLFNSQAYFVEKMRYSWTQLYFTNAWLAVDTFFLLSGLLVGYVFFKTVARANSFNIPMFYLHRFVRLTPALAIFTLIACTVYRFVANGPLWPYAVGLAVQHCPRNWWAMLIYINNYYEPDKMCLGHTWYLSVDMQLFWLSPLLLVPLWKKPRLGLWLGAFYLFLSMLAPFLVTYFYQLGTNAATLTFNGDPRVDDYNILYYLSTHCRASPYIMGILLGYFLYKRKSWNTIELTTFQMLGGWLLTAGMLLVGLLTIHPLMQRDYQYNAVEAAFFNALHRPAWSLGLGLLITLCTLGYGGIVNDFLSWKLFTPLSKLSYSIYLLHPLVQFMVIYSSRSTQYGEDVFLIPGHLGALTMTVLMSVVLCLFTEMPFLIIEKELLGGEHAKRTTKKKDDDMSPRIGLENNLVEGKTDQSETKCDIEIVVEPPSTDQRNHNEETSRGGIDQEQTSNIRDSEMDKTVNSVNSKDSNSKASSYTRASSNNIAKEERPDIGFEAIAGDVLSEGNLERHHAFEEEGGKRNSKVEIVEQDDSPAGLGSQQKETATSHSEEDEETGLVGYCDPLPERFSNTNEKTQDAVEGGRGSEGNEQVVNDDIVTDDECKERGGDSMAKGEFNENTEEAEIIHTLEVSDPRENQILDNIDDTIDERTNLHQGEEQENIDNSRSNEPNEQEKPNSLETEKHGESAQTMFVNELKRVLASAVSED